MIKSIIQCIIVDDEALARDLLEQYVDRIPDLECIGSYESPLDALPYIQNGTVDILLLDIQMPEITGIDFLKTIENKTCTIITSAYPEYALEGYQLNVSDYLVKPISLPRFIQAINKIKEIIITKRKAIAYENKKYQPVISIPSTLKEKDFIIIKSDKKVHKISLNRILYIEGALEYVSYYLNDGSKILILNTLRDLENTLPINSFIRIHRSYIVAFDKIQSISGNILEIQKYQIPIGKSYKEILKRKLNY